MLASFLFLKGSSISAFSCILKIPSKIEVKNLFFEAVWDTKENQFRQR